MRDNIGKLGATNLLKNGKGAASEALGSMPGLLKILALGLMLACSTAYASEPPSPAPVTMTKNKVDPAASTQNVLVSTSVGDEITDWSIGLLAVIAGLFFSASFLESRKKDRE